MAEIDKKLRVEEKRWERKCPKCHRSILYRRKTNRNWFRKRNVLCKSCSKIGKYTGRVTSEETKKKISEKLKGRMPKNIELLISVNYRRVYSGATRLKMRNSRIAYLKITGAYHYPNFNPGACEYFDKLNKERGWNGKHAKNGKEYEIGNGKYFLDFYDEDKNIVVEYDEPHHYLKDGSLRKLDNKRMNEIKTYLHCQFYRYNVLNNELKEY